MTPEQRKSYIEEAGHARCDLYILHAIMDILEGSSGNRLECGSRIMKICKAESQKALKRMDKAIAKAVEP